MTTLASPVLKGAAPDVLDVSGTRPIPLSRLIRVEMRKMRDTRSGTWLLSLVGVVAVLVTAGFFAFGDKDDRTFLNLLSMAGIPLGFALPVLGILLICSEWGQRTALVTFTLTPHRGQVLAAKSAAALLFAVGGIVVAAIPAAILAAVGGADAPWDGVTAAVLARVLLAFVLGVVWGLAFGAALLNSALAIVAYFLVPTIISIIGGIWSGAGDTLEWFDLNQSSSVLYDSASVSGGEWARLGTGVLVWIVVPAVIGTWRVLRSEVT
jgi:ABC-type transport system involved in multi-copper enzyme maturation permease subunit